MNECPLCGRYFPKSFINEHANKCLTDLNSIACASEREAESEGTLWTAKRTKLDSSACDVGKRASIDTPTQPSRVLKEDSDNVLSVRDGQLKVSSSKDSWKLIFKKCDQSKVLPKSPSQHASRFERTCVKLSSLGHNDQVDVFQINEADLNLVHGVSHSQAEDCMNPIPEEKSEKAHEANNHVVTNCLKHNNVAITEIIKHITSVLSVPLAEKMRPTSVDDYFGQGKLVGSKMPLRALIESNRITSMIFWGPPGCGKVCWFNTGLLSYFTHDVLVTPF